MKLKLKKKLELMSEYIFELVIAPMLAWLTVIFAVMVGAAIAGVLLLLVSASFAILSNEYFLAITAGLGLTITVVLRLFSGKNKIASSFDFKILNVTAFLFSSETQKEVFNPIAADWQEEYFAALSKKEIWKARWINVRYTYAFLAAMWQKSPIGDLIEFVVKIAKQ